METGFEIIEHTADIGIRAFGADLKEVFANVARGMFSIITELDGIEEVLHRDVEVSAPDIESLLVEWLNELVFIFDVENIIFKRFEITMITQSEIKARAYGEKVDKSRHEIKLGVKSATYHMTKVEKNDGYKAEVLLDI